MAARRCQVLATHVADPPVLFCNEGVIVSPASGTLRATEGSVSPFPARRSSTASARAPRATRLRTTGQIMAVARSSDLGSWGKMFRFVELAGPLECPQVNECGEAWTTLKAQFGATGPSCGVSEPPPPDDSGGCCDAGTGAPLGSIALGLGVALLSARRRRERSTAASRPRPR